MMRAIGTSAIGLVSLLLFGCGRAENQVAPTYRDTDTVQLKGLVQREFVTDPLDGSKGGIWVLSLERPINLQTRSPELDSGLQVIEDVHRVQIAMKPSHYKKYAGIPGSVAVVTGQLFPGHTRHHHTRVLIDVSEMELPGELDSGESLRTPQLRSTEWFDAVDSILGICDPLGHGPSLDCDEWRRAVHRSLPDEGSSLTFEDIGTDAWFKHVDQLVFWLYRSPPEPDWVYIRNLPGQTWTVDVWEPKGTTPQKRWYRIRVGHGRETVATVMHPYDGRIVGQWVKDLDDNGRMEMILAIQRFGTGAYGDVLLYEWTGDRLREVGGNDWKLPGSGYMGHDTITVSADRIFRTFPIFLDGDSNSRASGGRQLVRYSLQNGSLREVNRRRSHHGAGL